MLTPLGDFRPHDLQDRDYDMGGTMKAENHGTVRLRATAVSEGLGASMTG